MNNQISPYAMNNGNLQEAFKVSVNYEEKAINHLTKDVNPNLNLMFYDFNDYGQSQ